MLLSARGILPQSCAQPVLNHLPPRPFLPGFSLSKLAEPGFHPFRLRLPVAGTWVALSYLAKQTCSPLTTQVTAETIHQGTRRGHGTDSSPVAGSLV